MKLANLKNAADVDYAVPYTPPNYPGGLCLYLTEEQCEVMGITEALRAGTQVRIQAIGIVTTCSEALERDGDGDDAGPGISLSVQITDMGIEAQGVVRNAAKMLYGGTD